MATQISIRLPDTLYQRLDREARKRRLRRSDLIRQALQAFLDGGAPAIGDRPYLRVQDLVGGLSGGPPDLAERHREYLKDLIRDRR